jgi:hypothetical protein
MPIQEEQGAESLVLRGRRDPAVRRQPGEKPGDLSFAHVARMTLPVEENVAPDPIDVSIFGADAEMPYPDGVSDLVEKARLLRPSIVQRGHERTYDESDSICQVSRPAAGPI